MSMVAKSKDKSVRIRFPGDLLGKLTDSAARSGRSRNSEIVWRLTESCRLDKKQGKSKI